MLCVASPLASTFNAANQLTRDASFTYQYGANGNQIRKTNKTTGELTSYEYTAENQLVRVVKNGTVINYKFDGLGRRVEKEVNDGATTKTTRFVYDNEDILLELYGNNQIVARYTHGPGIDEPLILEKGGASFFYHADGLGSITEITDSVGAVKQAYTYSSFGKIESQLDPNFIQPYTFTAREFDPETELYHYRMRNYDWRTGRFNSVDPVGFAGGDFNLYAYVRNNPVLRIDPLGLASCPNSPEACRRNLGQCTARALKTDLYCTLAVAAAGATCVEGAALACLLAGPAGFGPCFATASATCAAITEKLVIGCQSLIAAEIANCLKEFRKCPKGEG